MKIALPSGNKKSITKHFGRAKYYVIVEVRDDKSFEVVDYIENTENKGKHHHHDHSHDENEHGLSFAHEHNHQHGHGHTHDHGKMLDLISHCQVVIASGMGYRLLENFRNSHFDLYFSDELKIDKAVQMYLDGELNKDYEKYAH